MATWKKGRTILATKLRDESFPLELLVKDVGTKVPRVDGTAVFMSSDPTGAPPVLLHHLKHNKVLHQRVVFLSIVNHLVPQVAPADRIAVTDLGGGFFTVLAHFGFMETADFGEKLIRRMPMWRKRLFVLMANNARPATAFFNLPPNRVVEMGAQIQI